MLEYFFNIRYIFGKENVWAAIDRVIDDGGKGFVVVADGVVVNTAQRSAEYRKTLSESLFATCDSGWIPVYIKKIYGADININGNQLDMSNHYVQYCGPQIFPDFIERRKHRMFFMGTDQKTLDGLKSTMSQVNPDLENMTFYELPFLPVEQFDYEGIAKMVEDDGADIIWVALGAPKQCFFMQRLLPYLRKGVMLGVGAAFKFYSGTSEKRCPKWIHDIHLEFVYRIFQDPKKQLNRCWWIVRMLPSMIREEKSKKLIADNIMKAMKKYVEILDGNGCVDNKKVLSASSNLLSTINKYRVSQFSDKINLYWLQMIMYVLDALDVTIKNNIQDTHINVELKQYAQGLVNMLDKNEPMCEHVLSKAKTLGIE